MIQQEKLEAVKEREKALRDFTKYAAIRDLINDAEMGIGELMEASVDNYKNKSEFVRRMTRVALNAWDSYHSSMMLCPYCKETLPDDMICSNCDGGYDDAKQNDLI